MARKLTLIAAVIGALLAPASAAAYLPTGFIGISPQSLANRPDFELMASSGIKSVRLPMNWAGIESRAPGEGEPDWSAFDQEVELGAENGMRILPFVATTPPWVAPSSTDLPVHSFWQRLNWSRFLRSAVERYGPEGEFWEKHTKLNYLPIRSWEIWNEENIVSFATRPNPADYVPLIRIAGRVLHGADPGAKVIIGGLFGRPLQIPPNVASGDYLARIYAAGNVKPFFDGVALHPYVADARAMGGQLDTLRKIMNRRGDARTPLYVTELGWGSQSGPTRYQRGLYGQANQLSKAFGMLSANRAKWHVDGVWWFSWSDEGGTCTFCETAGLLTKEREAKPSWYRFNTWTGGNPDTVPRAKFGAPEQFGD